MLRLSACSSIYAVVAVVAFVNLHHSFRSSWTSVRLQVVVESELETTESPSQTVNSTVDDTCFEQNSQSWLDGPRHGNTPLVQSGGNSKQLERLILNSQNVLSEGWAAAIQPTLCHQQSSLVKNASLPMDHHRLIYGAIHYHQHRHAIPEAQVRYNNPQCPNELFQQKGVAIWDYECPQAKHLVVSLGSPGLGANVRGGVNVALITGMANDRVAHVISNFQSVFWKEKYGTGKIPLRPWDLASCPRKDWQCVFWPLSPCVLSHRDLETAHLLNRTENALLRDKGLLPSYLNDTKVILMENSFGALHNTPHPAKLAVQRYVSQLIHHSNSENQSTTLDFATTNIPQIRRKFDRFSQTATVYSLRLLPAVQQVVADKMASLGGAHQNLVPSRTIGLPIRASDKCQAEADCLTYREHLQAATEFWQKHRLVLDDRQSIDVHSPVSMIVTSESVQIRREHDNFTTSPQTRFNYSFLTNSFEEPPDGGNANPFRSGTGPDADQAMIGSMASLHLQMHASWIVANSCSNYHHLLYELAQAGCAASPGEGGGQEAKFFFLQQSENPWFRVCCWIKAQGKGCSERRQRMYAPSSPTLPAS